MDQYFQESIMTQNDSNEKWKSVPAPIDESENNPSCDFECNICLDSVQDPVITLCGHLYCWPCIYKWIHFQSESTENPDQQRPQCPVCKAEVSQETLVPLYGRGQTAKSLEGKAPHLGIVVPRRPLSPNCGGVNALTSAGAAMSSHPAQQRHHRSYRQRSQPYNSHPRSNAASPVLGLDSTMATNGMYGEMVYARIFGNSETTLYTYPNSYNLAGSGSPRVRRHMMKAEESLSRVCFFLCCCVILCLLLF